MKKFILPLIIVLLIVSVYPILATASSAESARSDTNIPDDTAISYGYLKIYMEQLRQEIIEELTAQGGITVNTEYKDVSFTEGQMIILSSNTELIYRGGGAVVITSSGEENEGITDMAEGRELFSGESLEYGHIYYASESDSRKAVLITGAKAYFTVRGDYEIA
ncbi:MAG: hypothetical protein IKZ05_07090 [Clostridia bacterium]|nr:hypothetical protein [Clostridia bacterium]